jgi:hypothetical protein
MTKLITILFAGIVFSSCNNNGNTPNETTTDPAKEVSAVKVSYPYTIEHPDKWEIGSPENTMIVLNGLKAFENGNIAESMKYFGDSVYVSVDGFNTKVSNDSLKAMLTNQKEYLKGLEIKMHDWESVISKDKTDEFVSLWYKQKWEGPNGKKDSSDIMNDFKLKNGKVIEMYEYTRKYH